MNKRILELAEQAGIEFTYDPTETPMRAFVECWEDEMAKFAELMVQDCIRILHSNGYDDAAKCLQDVHFGIENPV